jgi:hypothetical protein
MVHQQPMSTSFFKMRASLLEQRINRKLQVQLLAPELGSGLGQSRFGPMCSLPLISLRSRTSIASVLVVVIVRVSSAWTITEASKEFVRFVVDAVHTRCPNLHAPVEVTGGSLEVDRVVGVVSQ